MTLSLIEKTQKSYNVMREAVMRARRSSHNIEESAIVESPDELITGTLLRDAEELRLARLALVLSWRHDQERVLGFIAQNIDPAEARPRVLDFMRNRLADLTEALGKSGEPVRASVWLFSPRIERLEFAVGSEIEHPGKAFAPGEGLIGRAFADNEIKNIADAPRRLEYAFAEGNEHFHGLLCIPLNQRNGPSIGVLCIDRADAEMFPKSAVDLGATLADLFAGVLTALPDSA
jgi:hypothetical protein